MGYTVLKFGGSVLRNVVDIERIVNVLRGFNQTVIVVSAIHGFTDRLIHIVQNRFANTSVNDLLYEIDCFTNNLINQFLKHNQLKTDTLKNAVASLKHRLTESVSEFWKLEDNNNKACLLSYGERFSALWVTYAIQTFWSDCNLVYPENIPLRTSNESLNATVEFSNINVDQLERKFSARFTVVPGFYGINKKGETTLFGRGGSDYTAAALAKLLNADALNFYKDSGGYCSADPKMVQQCLPINELTYDEAQEMARCGSRLLHCATFDPLLNSKTRLSIYHIANPSEPESVILNGEYNAPQIKSIVCDDSFLNSLNSTHSMDMVSISLIGNRLYKIPNIVDVVEQMVHTVGVCLQSNVQFKNSSVITFSVLKRDKILTLQIIHKHLFECKIHSFSKSNSFYFYSSMSEPYNGIRIAING